MGRNSFDLFSQRLLAVLLVLAVGLGASDAQRVLKPSSSSELQRALDSANPGDTVQMLPMVYRGDFVISGNGGILTGDTNSTIESEGVGLTIRGSNWKVKSFWIKGPARGMVIEGRDNLVEGVVLQKTGQAIVVRGEGNTVKACVISDADLGIIVETSRNSLYANSINIQTPAIIVPGDSCCNTLDGNVANGEVNIEGSGNKLNGNVCNNGLYVRGCDNELSNNVANGASFPKDCKSIDKGGNSIRGLKPGDPFFQGTNLPRDPGYYPGTDQPRDPGYYPANSGHSVPVQLSGNPGNRQPPKCSCTCSY